MVFTHRGEREKITGRERERGEEEKRGDWGREREEEEWVRRRAARGRRGAGGAGRSCRGHGGRGSRRGEREKENARGFENARLNRVHAKGKKERGKPGRFGGFVPKPLKTQRFAKNASKTTSFR